MLPRQGAEPIPGASGLRRARVAFLTCYVLILVPDQILVPELRARLPCKAHQHITAVSPRTPHKKGWMVWRPPNPSGSQGAAGSSPQAPKVTGSCRGSWIQHIQLPRQDQLLAKSPPGAKQQVWKGQAVSSELRPTVSSPGEMFFPVAVCFA